MYNTKRKVSPSTKEKRYQNNLVIKEQVQEEDNIS